MTQNDLANQIIEDVAPDEFAEFILVVTGKMNQQYTQEQLDNMRDDCQNIGVVFNETFECPLKRPD
jgi:hypothetical protein